MVRAPYGATPVPISNREVLLAALKEGLRVDGRAAYDVRQWRFEFGAARGHVEVSLGKTKVLARTSCEVARPLPDRPTDGLLMVNTEFSPMASTAFDTPRPTDDVVHAGRVIERAIKQSRAVDTEALCIVPGEKVWSLRVDIRILDDEGNVVDCACVAAMASLHHFRRPEVSISGEDVVIHTLQDRQPVPLSIHHTPIAVSFAFFNGDSDDLVVVDPTVTEENIMDGELTVVMNIQREVCAVSKAGGLPLDPAQVVRCSKIAAVKVAEIHNVLMEALRAAQ